IPSPGRSSASRRASSTGSPKCMNRPPLQVPTATCWRSVMPWSRIGRRHMPDWRSQAARRAADALSVRRTLTLALLAFAALTPAAHAATTETRIIVGRDPGLSKAERADIRHDAGVDLLHTLRIPNTEVVTTDTPTASLAQLRRDPDV